MADCIVQCCRCRHKHQEAGRLSRPRPRRTAGEIQVCDSVCPRCGGKSYYDITPWYAWCWRSGLIEMGEVAPTGQANGDGPIVFAKGGKANLRAVVSVLARRGYGASEGQLIVPGVPEAEMKEGGQLEALIAWVDLCAKENGKRHRYGVTFGRNEVA